VVALGYFLVLGVAYWLYRQETARKDPSEPGGSGHQKSTPAHLSDQDAVIIEHAERSSDSVSTRSSVAPASITAMDYVGGTLSKETLDVVWISAIGPLMYFSPVWG